MKLIVGLGNPGVRYENTRHNVGFMVMDELAKLCNTSIDQDKFEAKISKFKVEGEDVILMKPETFMNNSGFALRSCMDFYKIDPKDVLVIYDDKDLPVGKLRIRQKGSAGGHNGVKSIITCIFTQEFDRIRVGIGRNPNYDLADWVLSKFKAEERKDLDEGVAEAAKAAYYSINHPFTAVMNKFNKKAGK